MLHKLENNVTLYGKKEEAVVEIYPAYAYIRSHSKKVGSVKYSIQENKLEITETQGENLAENIIVYIEAAIKASIKYKAGEVRISHSVYEGYNSDWPSLVTLLYSKGFRVPPENDSANLYGHIGSELLMAVQTYSESKNPDDREKIKLQLLNWHLDTEFKEKIKKKLNIENPDINTVIDNLKPDDIVKSGYYTDKLEKAMGQKLSRFDRESLNNISVMIFPEENSKLKLSLWGELKPVAESVDEKKPTSPVKKDFFRSQRLERFEASQKENKTHPLESLTKKDQPSLPLLSVEFIRLQLNELLQYPHEERYRIIVDGLYHKTESGWVAYSEREKNCLPAAFNALGIAFSNLENQKVDLDLISKLYHAFTKNVELDNPALSFAEPEGKASLFRPVDLAPAFGLHSTWVTEEGILEILNTIAAEQHYSKEEGHVLVFANNQPVLSLFGLPESPPTPNYKQAIHTHSLNTLLKANNAKDNKEFARIIYQDILSKNNSWFCIAPCGNEYVKDIQNMLDHYNKNICLSKTEDQKLELIVGLAYSLEHAHLSHDANLRTCVIGLMNRLLVQQGFVVCTFKDPNIFDGYSKKELIAKVKEAMQLTRNIMSGQKEIFDFRTSDIPVEDQKKYPQITEGFDKAIASELRRLEGLAKPVRLNFLSSLSATTSDVLTKSSNDVKQINAANRN
jgi:hypothetical protein